MSNPLTPQIKQDINKQLKRYIDIRTNYIPIAFLGTWTPEEETKTPEERVKRKFIANISIDHIVEPQNIEVYANSEATYYIGSNGFCYDFVKKEKELINTFMEKKFVKNNYFIFQGFIKMNEIQPLSMDDIIINKIYKIKKNVIEKINKYNIPNFSSLDDDIIPYLQHLLEKKKKDAVNTKLEKYVFIDKDKFYNNKDNNNYQNFKDIKTLDLFASVNKTSVDKTYTPPALYDQFNQILSDFKSNPEDSLENVYSSILDLYNTSEILLRFMKIIRPTVEKYYNNLIDYIIKPNEKFVNLEAEIQTKILNQSMDKYVITFYHFYDYSINDDSFLDSSYSKK